MRQWGETARLLTLPGLGGAVCTHESVCEMAQASRPKPATVREACSHIPEQTGNLQQYSTHPMSGLVQRRPSKRWSASANVCLTSPLSWTPPGQQRRPAERHSVSTHFRRQAILLLLSEKSLRRAPLWGACLVLFDVAYIIKLTCACALV